MTFYNQYLEKKHRRVVECLPPVHPFPYPISNSRTPTMVLAARTGESIFPYPARRPVAPYRIRLDSVIRNKPKSALQATCSGATGTILPFLTHSSPVETRWRSKHPSKRRSTVCLDRNSIKSMIRTSTNSK